MKRFNILWLLFILILLNSCGEDKENNTLQEYSFDTENKLNDQAAISEQFLGTGAWHRERLAALLLDGEGVL